MTLTRYLSAKVKSRHKRVSNNNANAFIIKSIFRLRCVEQLIKLIVVLHLGLLWIGSDRYLINGKEKYTDQVKELLNDFIY